MPLFEESRAGREIVVPPNLPLVLKQFCKAAIRTQPYDLLKWSSSYFRALADGEEPPTKLRLEYPPPSTASGLTLGFLRVLLRQFGDYNKTLSLDHILRRWDCLCLDRKDLGLIMTIGKFRQECQVKKFLAIAVGLLGSSLFETMLMICELFSPEPDGGSAMVPVTLFMEIYGYLAGLRCDGGERRSSDEDASRFSSSGGQKDAPSVSTVPAPSGGHPSSLDRGRSFASQDTEADVDLDLELVSKDEPRSIKGSNLASTEGTAEDNSAAVEFGDESSQRDLSSGRTILPDDGTEASRTDLENDEKPPNDGGDSNHSESDLIDGESKDGIVERNSRKPEPRRSAEPRGSSKDGRRTRGSRKFYPNVPGIGARLSAEEVASVAIWMSECARLQEGMVGPRNLRHVNCPPLDRHSISEP
ncbi:hypothetical protein KM043_001457 [Ampulex compressa]|nr:hypothetical protein KM043_001457 [Ampulex compressa]